MTTPTVSLVIVNWNGADYLRRHLPSVLAAVERSAGPCEVIVVDNASADDSVRVVRDEFPSVRLVELSSNTGFIGGNNRGAEEAAGEIVVFLNNDVEVESDFLAPLLRHFSGPAGPEVFAVGSQMLVKSGIRKETGWTRVRVRFGLPVAEHIRQDTSRPWPTLYACGAAMAVDRRKFLELGGFHEIFQPFYWEDTDLSFRAWQRGWLVLYEPSSRVYHLHRGSIGRLRQRFIRTVIERNRLLFVWSNWRDRGWLLRHACWLPGYLLKGALTADAPRLLGFLQALGRVPAALKKRRRMSAHLLRSDRDILALSEEPLNALADPAARSAVQFDSAPGGERSVPADASRREAAYQPVHVVADPSGDRLKILVICPYLPVNGVHGGAMRMYQLIQHLNRRHLVDVVSFVTAQEEPHVNALRAVCRRLDLAPRSYPWQPDYFGRTSTMVDEFHSPDMHRLIRSRLLEERYDILQCEYLLMAPYAPVTDGLITVLSEHQVHFAARARDLRHAPWWSRPWIAASALKGVATETALCERFHAVVTFSDLDRRTLQWWLPSQRIEEIPLGADLDYFQPVDTAIPEWDIIFVGYFRHAPNIDAVRWFATHVWPRLKRERPNIRWVIVGSDPPPEIAVLAQQPGITVTGYVDDVRPYLARSRVCVAPIRLGRGLRVKLAEAFAMGKAVVSTSVGCEGYRVTSGLDIMIADRPGRFADAVLELLDHPMRARQLGEAARLTAELTYNWQHIGAATERLYFDLLRQRGTRRDSHTRETHVSGSMEAAEAIRPAVVHPHA